MTEGCTFSTKSFHETWKSGETVVDFSERVLRVAQFGLMGALVFAPKSSPVGLRNAMNKVDSVRFGIYALGSLRDVRKATAGKLEASRGIDALRDGSGTACNLAVLLLFLDEYTPFNLGEQKGWVTGLFTSSWLVGQTASWLSRVNEIGYDETGSFIDGQLTQETLDLVYCLASLFATEGKFQVVASIAAGVMGAARTNWPENEVDGTV